MLSALRKMLNVAYEFESIRHFPLDGKGEVYAVEWSPDKHGWNPSVLVGDTILLDGIEVVVAGVEMTQQMVSEDRPYRGRIGILPKYADDETSCENPSYS